MHVVPQTSMETEGWGFFSFVKLKKCEWQINTLVIEDTVLINNFSDLKEKKLEQNLIEMIIES